MLTRGLFLLLLPLLAAEPEVLERLEDVKAHTGVELQDPDARDPLRWEEALAVEGWLDAKVRAPAGEGEHWRFELGRRYALAGIDIEGALALPEAELRAALAVCLPDAASEPPAYTHRLRTDIRRIVEERYGVIGHLATVALTPAIDRERAQVQLKLTIVEGPPRRFTAIEFEGDPTTERWVLDRHIRLRPDRPFDLTRVGADRAALERTGWYKSVEPEIAAEDPEGVRLTWRVDPARTGSVHLGLGWTSDDDQGLARLTLRETNFHLFRLLGDLGALADGTMQTPQTRGGGELLEASWTESTRGRRVALSWDRPFRPSAHVRQFFTAESRERAYDDYELRRSDMETGFTLQRGQSRRTQAFYHFGWTQIPDLEADAPALAVAGTDRRFRSGLGLRYKLDTWGAADSKRTSGSRADLSYEYQGGPLGGVDLSLAEAGAERLWLIGGQRERNGRLLSLSARGAWVQEHDNSRVVPIADRFFLGGTEGPVGFDYRSVSPRVDGRAVGGETLILGRAAFHLGFGRHYLQRTALLYNVALLYDVGMVAGEWSGLRADKLRSGVGLGFYSGELGQTPRLYAGVPIEMEDGDSRRTFIVGFQMDF